MLVLVVSEEFVEKLKQKILDENLSLTLDSKCKKNNNTDLTSLPSAKSSLKTLNVDPSSSTMVASVR